MLKLEIAGTTIQLEDTEAALVIHCSDKWINQEILLSIYEGKFTDSGDIIIGVDEQGFRPYEKATVVCRARETEDSKTVCDDCAAIIPRINLNKKARVNGRIQAVLTQKSDQLVVLHAGNLTEIDWIEK